MEITKNVSIFIKKLRLNKIWTQQDLASKLYVTRQCISKWENGAVIPDISNVERLAKVFDVEVELFFKNEDIEEENSNKVCIDKNKYEIVRKKEKRSIKNYVIVTCLNILFALITIVMLLIGIPFVQCILVDLILLVISIIILIKSDVADLKTDNTIIYYKASLISFVINFALIFAVAVIPNALFQIQILHTPALLVTVLLIYFIYIRDKIGIVFSLIIILLAYDFGLTGTNSYMLFGLLAIMSLILAIVLLKKYCKNKKDLLFSIIFLLVSFSVLVLKMYEHSMLRNILVIVYTFLGLSSLVSFLFMKNKKYVMFGFVLYLIFIINRYMGYLLEMAFDRMSSIFYLAAGPSMHIGTIAMYILCLYLFVKLYQKYKKNIFLIGAFISLILYEITIIIGIRSEKIYVLLSIETNLLEILSYVSMTFYIIIGVTWLGINYYNYKLD